MCKSWRYTAGFSVLISMLFTCFHIVLLVLWTIFALGEEQPPGTPQDQDHDGDEQSNVYRKMGPAVFIVNIIIVVVGLGLAIPLMMTTCKTLTERNRRQCFIWVMVWLIAELVKFIGGTVIADMMSGHGHNASFEYVLPVLFLIFPAFVVPYAVELYRTDGDPDREIPSLFPYYYSIDY